MINSLVHFNSVPQKALTITTYDISYHCHITPSQKIPLIETESQSICALDLIIIIILFEQLPNTVENGTEGWGNRRDRPMVR